MPGKAYIVTSVAQLKASERRGIAFLSRRQEPLLDAGMVFDGLDDKVQRLLRSRFEYWIDGGTNKKWFHGFDSKDYRDCFVFKWKEKRQHHRLYGFLCNPIQATKPRFQVCVLASHATKNQEATDVTELDHVNLLRVDPLVRIAIAAMFPDGGGTPWKN